MTSTAFPVLAYGQPAYVPPPPPVDPGWSPLTMRWEAWDGSVWSFSDPDSGIIMMPGPRGMGGIQIENHRDDYASIPGSYWRDYRAIMRDVFWPIYVFSDSSSMDWITWNRAFAKTFRAGKIGRWVAQQPDGTERGLWCRYEKGLEDAFDNDPSMFGWVKYGIYLEADQPYWEGSPVSASFNVDAGNVTSFFGSGDVGGPPFYLQAPLATSGATISNPGDVDAWPVWTITGAMTSVILAVGSSQIGVPFAIADGHTLVIDTRPTAQTAILDGTTDMTTSLNKWGFAPIAPGSNKPLTITPVAPPGTAAQVSCSLVPLYEMAF